MTIRIQSSRLVGMLADLARTAHTDPHVGGATAGVLIYSDRGAVGHDPGTTTVLAGLSMNRRAVGHTAEIATDGTLAPTLLRIGDVLGLLAVLKQKTKGEKEHGIKHQVAIRCDGEVVEVVEDLPQQKLFDCPDAWRTSFAAGPIDHYPRGPWHLLAEVEFDRTVHDTQRNCDVPARPRTDFAAADLAPFCAIAARRHDALEIYRTHQRRPVGVQIGLSYRGAIIPTSYPDLSPSMSVDCPDAPIYFPELPPRKEQAPDSPPPVDLDEPDWTAADDDEPETDGPATESMFTDDELAGAALAADGVASLEEAVDAVVLADNGDTVPVDLLVEAAAIVVGEQIGSRSTVQRRLRVGKTMSGRIMDRLQAIGVLSASDGANPREVLARPDQLDDLLATIRGEVR